ncbi:FUSC family protein [Streptomyces sp. Li-HN-5-11]|uniref:FUSC family protein n=1 Tax=Streptomyces sp. Li-HN-5-11 TaxID=3075432 RepID=UPI0028ADA62F|nr:FUSC family protein [Streptomyces sp. Li-HN-5-11]WNM33126.1 FUSC family protein [Streptomyces sp. Li-HN-5-11]
MKRETEDSQQTPPRAPGPARQHRARALGRAVTGARPVRTVREEARRAGRAVRAAGRGPGRERDLVVQSLKAAAAALTAWFVASDWLGDPMALMAPWVALVMVQATVFSSLRRAAQQCTAICAGTLLASAAQAVTGHTLGALAVSLPVLMLLSNWSRFGDQGIYGATTAVFTLASDSVSASAVGHRLGQAVLGAAIGVAVNALVLPPIHLRDVRENLAALAREAGDLLCAIAGDLRDADWDARTASGWSSGSARLEHRLETLHSARRWSRESLRLTNGPLRALRRAPSYVPPDTEDERWSRVTGHIRALTRTLMVAADENRTPEPPDAAVLRTYARLLELIAEACHAESRRLLEGPPTGTADARAEETRRELHQRLQAGLRARADQEPDRTAVLGSLLLQAENLWAETVTDAATA